MIELCSTSFGQKNRFSLNGSRRPWLREENMIYTEEAVWKITQRNNWNTKNY